MYNSNLAKSKITLVLLCIVLLLSSCSTANNKTGSSSSLNIGGNTNSQPEKPKLEDNDSNFPEITNDAMNYYKEANLYKNNEPVSYKNIEYSNFKIQKSKKLLNNVALDELDLANTEKFKTDEKGTILDANTYLYVTMDITNKMDNEDTICLMQFFVQLDNKNSFKVSTIATIYRSGEPPKAIKDYFMQPIKAKETITVTVIAVVRDDIINTDNFYMRLDQILDEDQKADREPLEDPKAYKINWLLWSWLWKGYLN